jgi:tripartite-type tricarboxylate transporter receptor subunit TctC
VRSGNARALAVTSRQRAAVAPEFPTIAEAGVPGFDVSSWFAFFVPAKTPRPIIDKIHNDVVAALAHPPVRERLEPLGATIVGSTPEELAHHLQSEMDKWGPVISEAKIRIDE